MKPKLSDTTPTVGQLVKVANTVCSVRAPGGQPVTTAYQWFQGATAIKAAVSAEYLVRPADAGRTLKVKTTCAAADYVSRSAVSASSKKVAKAG